MKFLSKINRYAKRIVRMEKALPYYREIFMLLFMNDLHNLEFIFDYSVHLKS